jgi:hypothetical protein
MYQCHLRQGATQTVGWIEARGAKLGARVELKTEGFDDGLWLVTHVCQPPFAADDLRRKQDSQRNGLPSIQGRKDH